MSKKEELSNDILFLSELAKKENLSRREIAKRCNSNYNTLQKMLELDSRYINDDRVKKLREAIYDLLVERQAKTHKALSKMLNRYVELTMI